jgi:3-oxoacyl-[acyl-carrier-protein] synthase-1
VDDRKLHKLLGRTDLLGLYAAERAAAAAGLAAFRSGLDPSSQNTFNDRTGVFVGSSGASYKDQYDFFPLLTQSAGDLGAFGRDVSASVHPMWLLRTLPNNVLCHLGIRSGFKGPNACITNHGVSGALAVVEAAEAIRAREADRAIAVGHDTPIEPQTVAYYHSMGLLSADALRPFDAGRTGTVLGEGAASMVLESEESARGRGAPVLGEILGHGCAAEGESLLSVRDDGDGPERAMRLALADGGITEAGVGLIVAHGNGTEKSDASEARAIRRVFGKAPPPVTGFKWAFGNLLEPGGLIDSVLALVSLQKGEVPGIATLRSLDPAGAGLSVLDRTGEPRGEVALVHSRGFGGLSAALLLRATGR